MKKGKGLVGGLLILGLLLTLTAPVLATPEAAGAETAFAYDSLYCQEDEWPDTITVFGFGRLQGAPAGVQVSFGVTTYAPLAREAQEEHRRLLARVVANIGQEGVSRDKISTLYYNIWPEYGYGDDTYRQSEPVGYRVNSTISVHLSDTSLVSAVIDAAFAAGVDRLEGIRYLPSRELQQRALLAALQDARVQAEGVAAALGRKLGRVLAVDQSIAPPYELLEERYPAAGSSFELQQVEVSQYIRIVFCLE
ncbi:MAG: SIMPL domain-containing protein [bacterium]|jgi:uncharacterized protein YggE|nr:SIMPL domain-containing protein [Bacillota bacterium]HHW56061.1 SIMPL domain-containing protein [Bacillota bacterium]